MTEAATEDLPDAGPKPKQGVALALLFGTAAVGLALDQATKALALAKLGGGQVVQVADHWLQFRLVRNAGAAFSLGESLTWAFTILATVVVVGVVVVARRVTNCGWAFALGLLVAGAAGNLADRLFREPGFGRGHVIDFID
ncbi:MAG: signal peptidase II, partial [Bifidobacteriaceae bacterium]|nr:signal peptidase II [Bifidobacteriaceae bacterium]